MSMYGQQFSVRQSAKASTVRRCRRNAGCAVACLLASGMGLAWPVHGDVEVLDTDRVRVDWQDVQVLDSARELAGSLEFRISSTVGQILSDPAERVNLSMHGNPERILSRLLQRYNYVVRYESAGDIAEVTIMGREGEAAVASSAGQPQRS